MSAATRLILPGCALCAAAFLVVLTAIGSSLGGYGFPEDALVPADGTPAAIEVQEGRTYLVWHNYASGEPNCTVAGPDGVAWPLDPSPEPYWREGGSAGDWEAIASFESRAEGPAQVTCSGTVADVRVAVEREPISPPWLAVLGWRGPMSLVLGVAGLALIVGGLVLRVAGPTQRPARRDRTPGSTRTSRGSTRTARGSASQEEGDEDRDDQRGQAHREAGERAL